MAVGFAVEGEAEAVVGEDQRGLAGVETAARSQLQRLRARMLQPEELLEEVDNRA